MCFDVKCLFLGWGGKLSYLSFYIFSGGFIYMYYNAATHYICLAESYAAFRLYLVFESTKTLVIDLLVDSVVSEKIMFKGFAKAIFLLKFYLKLCHRNNMPLLTMCSHPVICHYHKYPVRVTCHGPIISCQYGCSQNFRCLCHTPTS